MEKIIKIEGIKLTVEKLKKKNKRIILAGGCFDLLHPGHIAFFQKAKEQGDILFVLLESDKHIKELKGRDRPINSQDKRADTLMRLKTVDFVILLPETINNNLYDKIIMKLKPSIIATTKGDKNRGHKERGAALVGAQVVDVIEYVSNHSTTNLIKISRDEK